ncbi:MAG TPA: tetratricopeptide repeat protein, partial [Chthonomonadales bacterium]|nr:tetratricopeptide repeat protein [Chthonomonadales bacterium]
LAIELAAARVRDLTIEQIADRLDNRLQLLTGGSKTALTRRQTMRASIDWSCQLLAEPEREFLRMVPIFSGGWTLSAAETISRSDYALDRLSALRDASLVISQPAGTSIRYRLLETVREYVLELLSDAERERLERLHAEYYLELAEQGESHSSRQDEQQWCEYLDADHDNLRVAFDFWISRGDGSRALRMAGALSWFWYVRGYAREGRQRVALALRAGADAPAAIRARAITGGATLAICQGDMAAGRRLHEESLTLFREIGDAAGIARALNGAGMIAWREGDYAGAEGFYQEALNALNLHEDPWPIAFTMSLLGSVRGELGDGNGARALLEESLAMMRAQQEQRGIAHAAQTLGQFLNRTGNPNAGRVLIAESLTIRKALNHVPGIAGSMVDLGMSHFMVNEVEAAREQWREAVRIFRELDDHYGAADALYYLALAALAEHDLPQARMLLTESFDMNPIWADRRTSPERVDAVAHLAYAEGRCETAVRLISCAAALRKSMNTVAGERSRDDRILADLKARVREPQFSRLWQDGLDLDVAEAARYARQSDAGSAWPS